MHDPELVRRFERLGDLPRDREHFIERQTATRLNHLRESRTVHKLHDER